MLHAAVITQVEHFPWLQMTCLLPICNGPVQPDLHMALQGGQQPPQQRRIQERHRARAPRLRQGLAQPLQPPQRHKRPCNLRALRRRRPCLATGLLLPLALWRAAPPACALLPAAGASIRHIFVFCPGLFACPCLCLLLREPVKLFQE
jgi:hypothetical protein